MSNMGQNNIAFYYILWDNLLWETEDHPPWLSA